MPGPVTILPNKLRRIIFWVSAYSQIDNSKTFGRVFEDGIAPGDQHVCRPYWHFGAAAVRSDKSGRATFFTRRSRTISLLTVRLLDGGSGAESRDENQQRAKNELIYLVFTSRERRRLVVVPFSTRTKSNSGLDFSRFFPLSRTFDFRGKGFSLTFLDENHPSPQKKKKSLTRTRVEFDWTGIELRRGTAANPNSKTYSEHNIICIGRLLPRTAPVFIHPFTSNSSDNLVVACRISYGNQCNHFKDFLTLCLSNEKQPRRIIVCPKYCDFVN